jgi:protein O-GlcNAc transferase
MAWLRILARVPNSILWLLRFPAAGEENLRRTANLWAGEEIASRIYFTNVAHKQEHIARVVVADLVLDTFEVSIVSLT